MTRCRIHAIRLKPGPTAPRLARAAVGRLLNGFDRAVVERALLVTSEVVTNAVIHARGTHTILLEATVTADRVRIVVEDGDEHTPNLVAQPSASGGFGLRIIDDCSDAWGYAPRDDGKGVLFELALDP